MTFVIILRSVFWCSSLFCWFITTLCLKKVPTFKISSTLQGSVATCVRWDGYCLMGFVANFVPFPAVQKFWNRLKFDKVTESLNRVPTPPGKSWNFYWKFSRTRKVLESETWSWKVLEFSRQWCSWQFLASNRRVSADGTSHNWEERFLSCRYAKNAFLAGASPGTPWGAYSTHQTL